MLGMLITLFVFGIMALVLFSIVLAVVGSLFSAALGLAAFLLFKVAPVLLVGWAVLKLVQRSRSGRRISAADQRWLDS